MAEIELPTSLPDLESARGFLETPLGIACIVLGMGIVVFVLAHFSGRVWGSLFGTPPKNPEDPLKERLAEYPPPPGKPGSRQLIIEGVPLRLRLVVVAPLGRSRDIE